MRITPLGPVFLSYRHSDGRELAIRLAWALRAAGVPVWHDVADLPPGDTTRRLGEALTSGLSGAVLLVTPEIAGSEVIRGIELPELLALERRSDFSFAVGNTIRLQDGDAQLDFDAPDRLLAQRRGTLRRLKQYPVLGGDADLAALALEMALQRMVAHRVFGLGGGMLVIDVQTRAEPRATAVEAGLVVRTPPPAQGHRAPAATIWPLLQPFLAALPRLVAEAAVEGVVVQGGAHPSVAFALGAALPTTAAWPVTVRSQEGAAWSLEGNNEGAELVTKAVELGPSGRAVAVLVDLVRDPLPDPDPSGSSSDGFQDHLAASLDAYAASLRIRAARPGWLMAAMGAATVADVAGRIRRFTSEHATNRVALFLRASFPVALLLGRTLNTLELELFEWEDGHGRPHYVPAVLVASGRGGSPIVGGLSP